MNEEAIFTWNKEVQPLFDNEDNEHEPAATTLESINDYCLQYIFKYLNILDVVNVAETCTRLQNFANDFIYPKLAKEIEIKLLARADEYPSWSVDGLLSLKDPFVGIGKFVERLSLVASQYSSYDEFFTMLDVEKILSLCPNLHTLRFERVEFDNFNIFKHVTSNLNELKIISCSTNAYEWSDALQQLPQLNNIIFTGFCRAAGDLFTHNMTLSSLAIDEVSASEEDLMIFLDLNGGSLQQLRLIKFSESPNFESIVTLIADKLPKLENLSIEDSLADKLKNSLSKLPHLKSLKINCLQSCATTLLRTLSDCGTIENLEIEHFVINDKNDIEKPLIFNQLQSLRCSKSPNLKVFLCLMAESEMPKINSVFVEAYESHEHDILKFLESKMSLKTMNIQFLPTRDSTDTFAFPLLNGIIKILNADWNRPYLTLQISPIKIGIEEEIFLNKNRHLISLNAKTKSVKTTIIRVRNCNNDYERDDNSYDSSYDNYE